MSEKFVSEIKGFGLLEIFEGETFENVYKRTVKEKGFEAVKKEYEENCINIGKRVRVIAKDGYEAEAVGINENGELLVKTDEGEIKTVFSGEVSIRNIQA